MARIICAAPPLFGHMTPLAALAGKLREHGHEVLVIDYFERPFFLPEGVVRVSVSSFNLENAVGDVGREGNIVSGSINALQDFCLDVFQETLLHCANFRPDLLVFDQLLPIAPMIAGELQCAYMYTISSPLEFFIKPVSYSPINRGLVQAFSNVFGEMRATLAEKLGIQMTHGACLPQRYLCFATGLFCGASPATYSALGEGADTISSVPLSFVGPALLCRKPNSDDINLAAKISDFKGKKFFVSLGSVLANLKSNRESALKIFRNVLLSHNERDSLFLFSAPEDLLKEAFEGLQINATVIVRPFVNQFYLMGQFSLVFGHGGYNTVAESLFHGVPMIAFPFVFDQTWVAQRLEDLGVGARISRVRHNATMLRDHADRLFTAPEVHFNLAALRADIQQHDGRARGAKMIDDFLCAKKPEQICLKLASKNG